MAALKRRKRYRLGGEFSVSDTDGFPRHFTIGDELPDEVLSRLNKGEIDSHIARGMFREIGAQPAPQPTPEPPKPLSVEEILRNAGWLRATVVDGQVSGGPAGYAIEVVGKAREGDLQRVAGIGREIGRETPMLIHVIDGEPVVTIALAKLAPRLVTTFGMR